MDRVHTIEEFHDGRPLSGFADFEGHPHFYQCQFDKISDDWSDQYALKKADNALLALALECQAIFLRWRKDFDAGKVPVQSHPGLTLKNPRYNELQQAIRNRIAELPETAKMVGRFDSVSLDQYPGNVQWSAVKT